MAEGEPSVSPRLASELRERTVGYVLTALGLVAGFAWNEAVKALIEYIFPSAQNGIAAKFVYAVLITAAVVIITRYLMRFSESGAEADK
jgi:hypothetical protein